MYKLQNLTVQLSKTSELTLELVCQLDPGGDESLAVSAPVRVELNHPGPVRAIDGGHVGICQLHHRVLWAIQGHQVGG